MFVTYAPEDGDEQSWEFLPGRVRVSEQVLVEKRAGARWDEWVQECKVGTASARRVLLWHLLRQPPAGHAGLRFEDTPDFFGDELLVELSVAELSEWRSNAEKVADDDERATVLAMFDEQIAESRAKHGDGGPGKVPSKKSSTPTAG